MNKKIIGLHHVTAIASDPQRNLDFYIGLLGLRLVKRTVNFDDPGPYHFYFGDARGTPGTILTFFPWPGARRGHRGVGQIEATAFAISPDSVGYWLDRFKEQHVTAEKTPARFGEGVIRFTDPDGLLLELIACDSFGKTESWNDSSVPEEHSLRGFHSVSAALEGYERTAKLLTESFGYRLVQAGLLICFAYQTIGRAQSRLDRCMTSPSASRTMPSSCNGASISSNSAT